VLLLVPFLISLVLYLLRLGMSVVRVPVFVVGSVARALFHVVDWFVNGLRNGYTAILKGLLRVPYVVLIGAGVLVLSIVPLIGSGRIGFSFSPALDSGQVGITLELPDGTDLNTTNEVAGRIEEFLQQQPEVDATLLNVGINESDIGNIAAAQRAEFTLELVPKQERSRRDSELAFDWVKDVQLLVSDRPEAKITGAAIQDAGPPEAADYSTVLASNDITLLREKDRIARTALEAVPYLGNVGSNFDSIVSERVFQVDTSKLDGTGLSVSDVYNILRAYNVGIDAGNLRDQGNEYPIVVKMNPESIRDQQTLLSLPIFAPALGVWVSLVILKSSKHQVQFSELVRAMLQRLMLMFCQAHLLYRKDVTCSVRY